MAPGGPRLRVLVEHDDGLDAVAELGDVGLVAVDAQAERALVPGDRAVEVGDREVHGAEPQRLRAATGASRCVEGDVGVMATPSHASGAFPMATPRACMDFSRAAGSACRDALAAGGRAAAEPRAVGHRRLAVVALERAREVQRVGEAGPEGDLADLRSLKRSSRAASSITRSVTSSLVARPVTLDSARESTAGGTRSASA